MSLEAEIDELYSRPLTEFVSSRAALASRLKGEDARRVKQLKKPTIVPWAVNQVYWHARAAWDRLRAAGNELRRAQLAALEGRAADVRQISDEHRKAIAEAADQALGLAGAADVAPARDVVVRTLEALSLLQELPEPPGRLTQPLQPGGFEMLAGTTVKAEPRPSGIASRDALRIVPPAAKPSEAERKKAAQDAREAAALMRARAREQAEADRLRRLAIKEAETAVARAQDEEVRTQRAWKKAKEALEKAQEALAELRGTTKG